MIIVKIQGGLGNQMFQYALGRNLSLKNKADLNLDPVWFKDSKNRKIQIDKFNLPENISIKTNWLIPFTRLIHSVTEKSYDFDANILNLKDNTELEGYWQSEKYFKEIESELRKEFTLKNGFGERAKSWSEKIQKSNSVSLHIRRGDYLESKHVNMLGVLPLSYYEESLRQATKDLSNPVVYVFSDDIEWAKINLKELGYNTEFVSDKSISDPEEMLLMSLCKNNITANSSFSWWAAWLNNNPDKKIFVPKTWFLDPKMHNKDLIPESWTKI